MRVRKTGVWTFNQGGPHSDSGFFVEAVDAADEYRYTAISYSFLEEETETIPLSRGDIVEVALITERELASRLPRIGGR